MTLWRVSNHAALDGGGGLHASGRWHTRGRRIVYTAPNPATALLEILVHLEIDLEDLPARLRYLEIDVPDGLSVETLEPAGNWKDNFEATQRAGDEWLLSGRSALLRVPCVIVPATWNVLVNPKHPESASIRVARTHEQSIDTRLGR